MAGIVGVVARGWLVNALTALGEFPAAEAAAREALAIAEPPQHPWSLALAHVSLGFVHLRRGALAEAVPVLERGLGISREFGVRAWLPMLLSSLGMARALSGDPAAGIPDLEEGIAQAEAMRIRSRHALRLGWLGEACLLAGQRERAREAADQALARAYGERGYEAWALRLLGEIASEGDADVGAAGEHYEAAIHHAEALGMRPLRAHCHLGLGILALRTGARDRASRHLSEAVALFRTMDMRPWHARADDRLRSLG